MIRIDIQTVIIFLFVGNFIALLFFLLHPAVGKRQRCDYCYIFARACQCFAWFFIAFSGGPFPAVNFNAGSVLLAAGFAFDAIAVTSVQMQIPVWLFRTLLAVPVIALIVEVNPAGMTAGINTGAGSAIIAIIFFITGIVFFSRWLFSSFLSRITAFIYTLSSIMFMVRSVLFFSSGISDPPLQLKIHIGTFFAFFVVMMTGTAGYILFKKELTEQSLLRETMTDFLTGVNNRRGFEIDAEKYMALSSRINLPVSMLMIDIDNFRKFNRRYGHNAGDEILKKLALMIRNMVRGYDLVCRYGGEEFVVLLPDTTAEVARIVAERIRVQVADVFLSGRSSFHYSVSIGVSSWSNDGNAGLEGLYDDSEKALYRAKKAGMNRVCLSKGK